MSNPEKTDTTEFNQAGDNSMIMISDSLFMEDHCGHTLREHNFPVSPDINRVITPSWVFFLILSFFFLLAWFRIAYSKYLESIFSSAINFQLSKKLFNEPGIIKKRIFIFLNIYYFLTISLFLYLLADYYNYHLLYLTGIHYYLFIAAALIAWFAIKSLIMKVTGILFNREILFSEALFHSFLFKKIAAILTTPLLFLIAYTRGSIQDISIYFSCFILSGVVFLRLYHQVVFIYKSVVFNFYFIFYLCTLEILPVLVIFKLIFSLSKGT